MKHKSCTLCIQVNHPIQEKGFKIQNIPGLIRASSFAIDFLEHTADDCIPKTGSIREGECHLLIEDVCNACNGTVRSSDTGHAKMHSTVYYTPTFVLYYILLQSTLSNILIHPSTETEDHVRLNHGRIVSHNCIFKATKFKKYDDSHRNSTFSVRFCAQLTYIVQHVPYDFLELLC